MTARRPASDRFVEKWQVEPETGCHLWTAGADGHGYGLFRDEDGRSIRAHIFAYQQAHGPVPAGLQLDHFRCDNPPCCNPDHVRPVTPRENTLRSNNMASRNLAKTHCAQGHPFDEQNTRWTGSQRICRVCRAAIRRRGYLAKEAPANPWRPDPLRCARGHLRSENMRDYGYCKKCLACGREYSREYEARKRLAVSS